jgi:hypothetical protein
VVVAAGQFGEVVYNLSSVPIWYLSNLYVLAYPFLAIYNYANFGDVLVSRHKLVLAIICGISCFISVLELVLAELHRGKWTWVVGNTLFALVGMIAFPAALMKLPRRLRRQPQRVLPPDCLQPTEEDSNLNLANGGLPSIIDQSNKLSIARGGVAALYVSAVTVGFGLGIVWISFLNSSGRTYWNWLIIVGVLQVLVVYCDSTRQLSYNFYYIIFYSVVMNRMPDFLGHIPLHFFNILSENAAEQMPEYTLLVRLVVIIGFVIVMQAYLVLLTSVVSNMTEPHSSPEFLFLGQLYFYVFWYLLVASDFPVDALYWSMLVLSNVHFALSNTSSYGEVIAKLAPMRVIRCGSPRPHSQKSQSRTDPSLEADGPQMGKEKIAKETSPYKPKRATESDSYSLLFLIKLAEQDSLADITALVMVPSLIILMEFFDSPYELLHRDKTNLWMRCLAMFACRMCSARISDGIFAWKVKMMQAGANSENKQLLWYQLPGHFLFESSLQDLNLHINGVPLHLSLRKHFQDNFWYFVGITVVVTFECFQKPDIPARFCFLRGLLDSKDSMVVHPP